MQEKDNGLKLMYSCILSRGKERIVRVAFERDNDYAEGIVPDGKIEKNKGFSVEEVAQLEVYLQENKADILKKAKEITGINHWF